jgi:TrmH family RNA methyltransferase
VPPISSRQNPLVKQFRAVAASAGDDLLLDGPHLLDEAVTSGLGIDLVAVRDDIGQGPVALAVERAKRCGARVVAVTESVLAAMSPVRSPSGVVALARRPSCSLADALASPPQLVLMLADVQDPGNVGAIVRAADGCGATGVIASEGSADPFGWKALRGSMGSAFRIPVAARQPLDSAVRAARERGIAICGAVPRDGTPLPRCDLRRAVAVVLGGEGAGIPAELLAQVEERLTIPMRAPVESLNVSTAAALVAYEAMRQRQNLSSRP